LADLPRQVFPFGKSHKGQIREWGEINSLYLLAVFLIGVVLVSLFLSKKLKVANRAITGIGAGTVLLGLAFLGLIRFLSV
jgi:small-conductance mechanosensitive channel